MSDNQEIGRLLLIVSSYLSDGSVAYPVTAGEIARSNALDAVMRVRNLLAASPKVAAVEPVARMERFPSDQAVSEVYSPVRPAWLKSTPPVGTLLYAGQPPVEQVSDGKWVRCTPNLLNAGVDCGCTPRRPGDGTYSHDHFIAHGEQVSDDKRDAALAVMRCPDCMGPVGEDHSESCGLGIGPVLWAESSPFATTPPWPINHTGDAK